MRKKYGLDPIGTNIFSADGSFNIPVKMRPLNKLGNTVAQTYADSLQVIPSVSDIHKQDGRYTKAVVKYDET